MKKPFRSLVFVLVAVLVIVGLRIVMGRVKDTSKTGSATSSAIPVTVASVARRDIVSSLTYTGTVTPARSVALAPKVTGQILSIPYAEGTWVQAGELLVQIDPEQFAAAVTRLEAKVEQVRLSSAHQEAEFARFEPLWQEQAISEQQYEKAKLARDLAAASLREAEAALEEARANLANTEIRAPEDGVLLNILAEPGDLAVTGKPIITFASGRDRVVEISVIEQDLPHISTGMKAFLAFSEIDQPLTSAITHIDPALDPVSRTARVRVAVPEEALTKVRSGMSAQVTLVLSEEKNVLAVPARSLVREDDGTPTVYVIRDGRAEKRAVRVGESDGDYTQIEGLSEGNTVAVDGISQLYDGAAVFVFTEGGK